MAHAEAQGTQRGKDVLSAPVFQQAIGCRSLDQSEDMDIRMCLFLYFLIPSACSAPLRETLFLPCGALRRSPHFLMPRDAVEE